MTTSSRSLVQMQGTITLTHRSAMVTLDPEWATAALLVEPGREGLWTIEQGEPPEDPRQGIYIPSEKKGFYWRRAWDGVHGQPEWFHDGGHDWLATLQACIALVPCVQLGPVDYPISDTWAIELENRTIRGTGRFQTNGSAGTRIVLMGASPVAASADVMRVGYRAKPSGAVEQAGLQKGFLKNVRVEGLALWRDAAPNPCHDGLVRGVAPAGLRAQYLLKCHFRDLLVQDSTCGVYIGGTIYTKFDDIEARIDRPTSAGNYDTCTAWVLDGTVDFGYGGGNASLYMSRCIGTSGRRNAATSLEHGVPAGLISKGAFVDCYIDQFEVAGSSTGMVFIGAGYNTFSRNGNLHLRDPIIDQADYIGLEIGNAGTPCAIEVTGAYIAPLAGAQTGLLVYETKGLISIMGGQIIGGWTDGGFKFVNTQGLHVDGLKVEANGLSTNLVQNAQGARLMPMFSSPANVAFPAITITGASSDLHVAPAMSYAGGMFSSGVAIDKACSFIHVDASAMTAAALASADRRRKVLYDNAPAKVGHFGNGNLRSGI